MEWLKFLNVLPPNPNLVIKPHGDIILKQSHADLLEQCNKVLNDHANARSHTLKLLKEIASDFDANLQLDQGLGIGGGAVALTGTGLSIAAGTIMLATGGAAAPILISSLIWSGVGIGLTGGALKLGGAIACTQKQNELLKTIWNTIRTDMKHKQELQDLFDELQASGLNESTFVLGLVDPFINRTANTMLAYAYVHGSVLLLERIEQILPSLITLTLPDRSMNMFVQAFLSTVLGTIKPNLTTSATFTSEQIAMKAVQSIADGHTKEAAFQAAKIAAQEAGDDTIKATQAAQQASQLVVKNSARIAGGVTIGLGLAFIVWDIVLIVKKAKQKSLGDVIRAVVLELEKKTKECNNEK